MFIMTAGVKLGPFKPVRPSSLKWKRSIDNYSDSATIKLPAIAKLKTSGEGYKYVDAGLQFSEGMTVELYAGYNGRNDLQFKGFISRINYTVPLEIECEGYSYQLRQKLNIRKSFPKGTKLKTILNYLVEGTDIKLSKAIPDITIEAPVTYQNASGTQVLDWIKEKLLQTVHFNYDELYVGIREAELKGDVKFRLGWNVIKDNELKFSPQKQFAEVKIELVQRGKDGAKKRVLHDSKFTNTKMLRLGVPIDEASMKRIAADKKKELVNTGYEGAITCFLWPYAEPGMAAMIDDPRYTERKGKYFIEAVDGSFSTSGGRQKVKIGNVLSGG